MVVGSSVHAAPASGMAKPKIHQVHPLHKEWMDAETEFDDVPEEVGDWVDQEELDEDGIPVVSGVTRERSSCILDAPGAVHVDNFTDDEELIMPSLSIRKPDETKAQAHTTAPVTSSSLTFLPSRSLASLSSKEQQVNPKAEGPVVTLEEEIKKMKESGRHQAAMLALSHFSSLSPTNIVQPNAPLLVGGPEGMMDDLDAMSKESWKAAMSNALAPPPSTLRSTANGFEKAIPSSLIEEEDEESQPIRAEPDDIVVGADGQRETPPSSTNLDLSSNKKQQQTLPGECLATDSGVEAAEVDPFDSDMMLEDMGLKDRKEESVDEEEDEEEVEHLDLTQPTDLASAATSSTNASSSHASQAPHITVVTVPSSSAKEAGQSTQTEDDTVTFEAVEKFSIDPSFDYDNVKLTPRGFPYNLRGNPLPSNFKK